MTPFIERRKEMLEENKLFEASKPAIGDQLLRVALMKLFRIKVTGVHQVGIANGSSGEVCIGVLQNKPQYSGNAATVAIRGVTKVVSDVAITAGAKVYVSSDGQATGTASTSTQVVGIAVSTTANAGELVSVLLLTT